MTRPPNVLWLVSDHQALANRGTLAQSLPLQSRLAAEGLRFTRAYTPLPICSPARASMLTGLYPHAHGLTENDGRFGGREGLDESDWLITDAFLQHGFRCAWFGKWHVDNQHDATRRGLEGFSLPGYGYPYNTDHYAAYLSRNGLPPPVVRVEMPGESATPRDRRIPLCEMRDWFDFEAGVVELETPRETHEAFFLAELAGRWLQGLDDDQPFFLRLDTWGPHPPYTVPAPMLNSLVDTATVSPNLNSDLEHRPAHHRDYRDYWRHMLDLDAAGWQRLNGHALEHAAVVETALAGLLDTLDRLDLARNTLVAFTADHGDATGSNGGVSNKGGLMVEETMRVPLLLRGPGIAAGESRATLVANFDLVPTLLRCCGIEVPANLHARDLLTEIRDGLLTQHYGLHESILQRAWYSDGYKLVIQEDGFVELYDLRTDPGELINLANDSRHFDVRDELRRQMVAAMLRHDDTEPRTQEILNA